LTNFDKIHFAYQNTKPRRETEFLESWPWEIRTIDVCRVKTAFFKSVLQWRYTTVHYRLFVSK